MASADRWKLNFVGLRRLLKEDNKGFVSWKGMFKFHLVNIKCRVGYDMPDGILMKGLRGSVELCVNVEWEGDSLLQPNRVLYLTEE